MTSRPARLISARPNGSGAGSSGKRAFDAQQPCVVDDEGRVGARHRAADEAVGIRRRRRRHDLEAGRIGEHAVRAVAVLRRAGAAHAVQIVERDGHIEPAAGHVMRHRRFVHDLRPGKISKRGGAEIDEGARAGHRRAGRERGDGGFRCRRIDHASREIAADAVHQRALGTEAKHIAADDAGARIGGQTVVQGRDERGGEACCFAHRRSVSRMQLQKRG